MTPRSLLLALGALAGVLAAGAPASATLLEHRTVPELAWTSDAVVRGGVVAARVGWSESGQVIVTTFTIDVAEVLGGEVEEGPLTVTRVGGEVDGVALGYAGMPQLAEGDDVVLFLRRRGPAVHVIVGLCQGAFRLRGGTYVRDLDAVVAAAGATETWRLDDLRTSVRRSRAGRP